ncbi:MAG: RHS repeat-associated core domain-containing protein [Actinomycetota bacterium]
MLAPENRIRFTGQLLDTETNLYDLRARQYDFGSGRFLSTDPLTRTVGNPYVTAYGYVDARPTFESDPSGLRGEAPGHSLLPAVPYVGVTADTTALETAEGACELAGVACGVAAGVTAAGALLGVGVYEIDPFNKELENFGADLYGWLAGQDQREPERLLWRAGANTAANFTPRPEQDVEGWPLNGLSVFNSREAACKRSPNSNRAQGLAPSLLRKIPGLIVVPDPAEPGHFFLAGALLPIHAAWAATRNAVLQGAIPNPLTTAVQFTRIDEAPC